MANEYEMMAEAEARGAAAPKLPVPAAEPFDYDAAAQAEASGQMPDSLGTMAQYALKTPSDTAARILAMKKKTGLDEDIIGRKLDDLEKMSKASDFDPVAFRRNSPVLASWMEESPNNTAAVWQDRARLGKLESYATRKPYLWPKSDAEMEAEATRWAKARMKEAPSSEDLARGVDAETQSQQVPAEAPQAVPGEFKFSFKSPTNNAGVDEAGASKADEEERLKQQYLARIRQDEEFISGSGKVGLGEAMQRTAETNPAFLVPFVASIADATDAVNLYRAAKAAEAGTATEDQVDTLMRAARLQEALAARGGESFLGKVGKTVAATPAFMGEFAATAGFFKAGQAAAYKGGAAVVEKTIQNVLKKVITNPRFIVTASHAPSALVGTLAQFPIAAALRIPTTAIQRMTPDGGVETKDGQVHYQVQPGSGESFGVALPKAMVDSWAEVASEHTGKVLEFLDKPFGKLLFGWWAPKHPGATAQAFAAAMRHGGFNGVLGEMGEEEVGKLMKAVGGLEPYKLPSAEELAVEAVAFSAPGAAHAAISRIGAERAQARADVYADMAKNAQESEVATKAPDAGSEIFKRMTQGRDLYIRPEAFIQLYQDKPGEDGKPMDPRKVAEDLLGSTKEFDEAVATGREMRVPMEVYLSKVARTEQAPEFARHISEMQPDGSLAMSASEAEDWKAKQDAADKAAAEAPVESRDGASRVGELVQAKYEAAGRPTEEAAAIGKLNEAVFRVRAERRGEEGVGPRELLQAWPETVTGPKGQTMQVDPAQEGPRARLGEIWSQMHHNQTLPLNYIDSTAGTLNRRAFEALPADPAKPFVAHISVKGMKYANDKLGGHQAGDALYRQVGQALMDQAPLVAKVGGDFAVRVSGQEELNKILDGASAAMPSAIQLGDQVVNAKAFTLTGAIGEDLSSAADAHKQAKIAAEAAGTREKRGEKPAGIENVQGAEETLLDRKAAIPEALVKAHSALKPGQVYEAVNFDPESGMLTEEGRAQLPRKAFQASLDLNWLGAINNMMGEYAGDRLLRAFEKEAQLFAKEEGLELNWTHKSGDEYLAEHDDGQRLEKFMLDLEKRLHQANLEITNPITGDTFVLPSIEFGVGIGASNAIAEHQLKAAKERTSGRRSAESLSGTILRVLSGQRLGQGEERRVEGSDRRSGVSADLKTLDAEAIAAREQEQVQQELDNLVASGGVSPITDFIKSNGGLNYLAITEAGNKSAYPERPSGGRLYTRDGKTPDRMVLALQEAGLMGENATESDLIETLRNEAAAEERLVHKLGMGSRTRGEQALKKVKGRVAAARIKMYQGQASPRGSFSPTESGAFIDLFKRANVSTALHENWHKFFFYMAQDAAYVQAQDPETLTPAQQSLLDDYAAILKQVKATSFEQMTSEQHELIASWGEQYMREGKAPTAELQPLFDRFVDWMVRLYKSAQSLLRGKPGINSEMRGIFDRWLASTAAIERESQDQAPEAMPGIEEPSYLKAVAEAKAAARSELAEKLIRQDLARRKREWRVERKERYEKALADTKEEKPYKVLESLMTGKDSKGEPAIKLDKASFVAEFGENSLRDVPPEIFAPEGEVGAPMDFAAFYFDYDSASFMVQDIARLQPAESVAAELADKAMDEAHGNILLDGTLPQEAVEALNNPHHAEKLRMELKWLAQNKFQAFKGMTRKVANRIPTSDMVKQQAREMVGRTRVRDLTPQLFRSAENKARNASVKAFLAGDLETAFEEKQREVLNNAAFIQALKAQRAATKMVDGMKKYSRDDYRSRIALGDKNALHIVDSLLSRFGINRRPVVAGEEPDLEGWEAGMLERGKEVYVPPFLLDQEYSESHKNLTFSQLQELSDVVKAVAHDALNRNKLMKDEKQRDTDEAIATGVASIIANSKGERPKEVEDDLPQHSLRKLGAGYLAMQRKFSSLVRMMDGYKDGGPMWELFVRPMNAAGDEEAVRNEKSTKELFKIVGALKEGGSNNPFAKEFIPEIGRSLTRKAQLAVALNAGTQDNLQKLMDGYGWNEQQVQAIIDRLTKSEVQFVQATLDHLDSYWPEIKALHERMYGFAPSKVEAKPIQTKHGELRGGYYPLKYRPGKGGVDHLDAVQLAKDAMRGATVSSTTRHGHRKERTKSGGKQIRLELNVLFEHVSQVNHDLSHYEYLIDANRLMRSPKMRDAINAHYGDDVRRQMEDAIQDVAAGNIPAQDSFEKAMAWLRSGSSVAAMAWNFVTAAMQPLGATQSMVRIGPKYFGRGLKSWLGSAVRMESTAASIYEKSAFMRLRSKTQMREIHEIRGQVQGNKLASDIGDSYFWMIYKMQQTVDIPTWMGAYEKATDEGHDEKKAIAMADQAVIDSQGGGQVKDLSQAQRGGKKHSELFKLWTNFFSFGNTTFNLSAEAYGRADLKSAQGFGRFMVDMALLYTIPAVLTKLLRSSLKGGGGDDDEDTLNMVASETAAYMANSLLGIRDMAGFLQGYNRYEGPSGSRFFAAVGKLSAQIQQGEWDDKAFEALNSTAGILFHYPATQLERMATGFLALSEGETENPAALIFGAR